MRHTDGHANVKRAARSLAVAGLLPVLLIGCGRAKTIEVTASAPRPQAPAPAGPFSVFQGQVAAVDAEAGEMVVDVKMVWTPEFKAEAHQRLVVVDPHAVWEPGQTTIALLHVGDEVQVDAVESSDGSWHASKVQLFDID